MPFRDALHGAKQLSATRFRELDGMLERLQQVEEYCRIEDAPVVLLEEGVEPPPKKKNKFTVLEDTILANKVELQEQMSDFTHAVHST